MTDSTPIDMELILFWDNLARTVAEGEFNAYAENYHADAVYISSKSGDCHPVARALSGWKQGFAETRAGKNATNLQFRFDRQLRDRKTAHLTGIFRYSKSEPPTASIVTYTHFETLLVKKGQWRILMEYQKDRATLEEWDKLS